MAYELTNKDIKLSLSKGIETYKKLRKEVIENHILDKAYAYYSILIILVLISFFGSIYLLYRITNPIIVLGVSLFFACVVAQIMGLIHDAGHRSIAKSVKINNAIGHFFSFLLGSLFEQWRPSHDRHHAHTNEHDADPDINIPLLSFTRERAKERIGWQRLAIPYQAFIYFPFGSLVWISLRLNNIKYLRKKHKSVSWIIELTTWIISLFLWFGLPFLIFPLWKALLIFFVANFSIGLYALHVFAPNHKGMPEVARGVKLSFFEQQIVTSRNVTSHPILDQLYLGLNYQIEHHLFPNCPRIHMAALAKIVRRVCKEQNLPYEECTPLQVDRIILGELALVSAAFVQSQKGTL